MELYDSRVLVLVTHYEYENYLSKCLNSIRSQTIVPSAIVVVDDCSQNTPKQVLDQFPEVTLMQTSETLGPYAIIEQFFQSADYDFIMLHDADDWSHPRRLELLLECALTEGADIVGCQMESIVEDDALSTSDIQVPTDPKAALLMNPLCHTLYLSSALVRSAFARELGGLSTGFRFGADSEFVRRAVYGGKVLNLEHSLYYRRVHGASLTQSATSGFGSKPRIEVQQLVQSAAIRIADEVKSNIQPDLKPIKRGKMARLQHVQGPRLKWIEK